MSRGDRDLLPGLLALLALVVYLTRGFDGFLSPDVGTYTYAGQRVADGLLPYEGLVNRAGPLAHWMPGLGVMAARTVGVSDLFGARLLFMALSVAAVLAVYYLARDIYSSRLVGVVAALALLSFRFFTVYATGGPREKTLVVLLMLLAWLAAHHRRWVLAGVLVALATLTWQIAFVWLGPSVAVAALLVPEGRGRALLQYLMGGVGTLLVCVLAFVAGGGLDLFLDGFYRINRDYSAGVIGLNPSVQFWAVIRLAYGWSVYGLVVALACTIVMALGVAQGTVPSDRRGRTGAAMVLVGSVCGGAWTAVVFDGNSDTLPLLPGAALSLGAAAAYLRWWRPRVGRWFVMATTLAAVVVTIRVLVQDHAVPVSLQRREVATVFDRLPPEATLLVAGAPEVSVLADKVNPTRFQRFTHGLWGYLDDTWPGGQAGYLDWLDRSGTTVLAVRAGTFQMAMRAHGGLDNYVVVGPGRDWRWYVNTRTTTHATRVRIRRALLQEEEQRAREEERGADGAAAGVRCCPP